MKCLKRDLFILFILSVFYSLTFASETFASEIKHKKYNFTASKKKTLRIRLETDAGRVQIRPGSDDRDIHLDFRYDDKRYEISVDFDEDANDLRTYFDVKKWFKDDDDEDKSTARLIVELPTDVPIELYCKTKAGETEIELGDLHIVELTLRVLAGETFLSFSEPNHEKIKELKIESKIGELIVEKLGNANFEYAEIKGNIGELSIDFSADYEIKYDRDIEMSLNIGQTRLYFPEEEAFKFSVSKFLFFSDLNIPRDFYKEGRYYYSDNFDDAKYKTHLTISPGMGSLDIRVR